MSKMRVALVHDDFAQWGGAERLVLAMTEIWPDAPIYTSFFDEKVLPQQFPRDRLRTSFMQNIPGVKIFYRHLFFLYPWAFESFRFDDFDVVISSTTRFAKAVLTKPNQLHICYCNTPTRFLWDSQAYASSIFSALLFPLMNYLRVYDQTISSRVDFFIANSANVAKRIKKYYQRDSTVIYPFVELERFNRQKGRRAGGDYFLIVSRLSAHKRVDLAIEAFNELNWPLLVVGDGPERKKYKRMAKSNIKILSGVSDRQVATFYQDCTALIYPQEEDFGITALEAQAAGKPVIAFRGGGALETVTPGVTGEFFFPQTVEVLIAALRHFDPSEYSSEQCQKQAHQFSKERFQKELLGFVEQKWQGFGRI